MITERRRVRRNRDAMKYKSREKNRGKKYQLNLK